MTWNAANLKFLGVNDQLKFIGLILSEHSSGTRRIIHTMYCPGCGSEERQMSQYCRTCGTDLRPVRLSLERPDAVTASAVGAREEIGQAFAEKIREADGSRDLKRIAEDVLPQIEKFLESPEEKRLRRMRAGVITASIGLGAAVLAKLMLFALIDRARDPDTIPMLVFLAGLGIVCFAIGLGFVLNGFWFTRLPKQLRESTATADENLGAAAYTAPQLRPVPERAEPFRAANTSDFAPQEIPTAGSVTDHTTKHLKRD